MNCLDFAWIHLNAIFSHNETQKQQLGRAKFTLFKVQIQGVYLQGFKDFS